MPLGIMLEFDLWRSPIEGLSIRDRLEVGGRDVGCDSDSDEEEDADEAPEYGGPDSVFVE